MFWRQWEIFWQKCLARQQKLKADTFQLASAELTVHGNWAENRESEREHGFPLSSGNQSSRGQREVERDLRKLDMLHCRAAQMFWEETEIYGAIAVPRELLSAAKFTLRCTGTWHQRVYQFSVDQLPGQCAGNNSRARDLSSGLGIQAWTCWSTFCFVSLMIRFFLSSGMTSTLWLS